MNDNLKQFSEDLAAALKSAVASHADFIAKTKASGEDRTFEVVMSTSDEDRQGDSLDQSTWDFKYFDMNPVLLWAHNYQSFPIGTITDIRVEGDEAIATGKFAPAGLNPEADLACALYEEKILRAVSPGYIQNDDGTRELLEVSFCPVPAGRYALSLRQVRSLGLSTRELIAKGFFYKKDSPPPKTKADNDPVIGDPCELDDGTPGVLAEDEKNPNRLVCVPPKEGKSKSTKTTMNELEKKLKAEHERHGEVINKHIDEFEEKASEPDEKARKDAEGVTPPELEKHIDEFEEKMDGEHQEHLDKCMKAVDEAYKIDPEEKSIDEFKKAIEDEHLKHVKAFHKAIQEFEEKTDGEGQDRVDKGIQEFRTKAEEELARHEEAHMDLCEKEFGEGQDDGKADGKKKGAVAEEMQEDAEMQAKYKRIDKAYSVFSAFISAYLDEKTGVDDYDKLLDEAVVLMKDTETKLFPNSKIRPLIGKSGRTISGKTKEKLESIVKALGEHHDAHGKSTDTVIAALKELMVPPKGDEGKDDADRKSHTPNARSSSAGAATNKPMSELDAYLFAQRLMRQIKSASEDGLRQIKDELKTKFPSRR